MKNELTPCVIEIKEIQKQVKTTNDFVGHSLEKGKYDINYVITLLQIIEKKCHEMQMQPRDLSFTLRESCKRLIAMLIVEKNQSG